MGLGTLQEQNGDTTGAKEAYSKVLNRDPHFAPAANNLAWLIVHENMPDLGDALRLALVAKERFPEDPNISDTLGYIHYKRNAFDLATTQFRLALEDLPHVPTIRYHLALSLKGQGADDEALKELEQALQSETAFPEQEEAKKLLETWREDVS